MVSNTYLDVISSLDQIFDLSKKKFHFHLFMLFSLRNTLKCFLNSLFSTLSNFFRRFSELSLMNVIMILDWK